jgi:hypothetical protein
MSIWLALRECGGPFAVSARSRCRARILYALSGRVREISHAAGILMSSAWRVARWAQVCPQGSLAGDHPAWRPSIRRSVDCSSRRVEPASAGTAAGGMSLRKDRRKPSGETRSRDRCSSRFIEPAVAVSARALRQIYDVIELCNVACPRPRTAAVFDPCATVRPPTLQLCLVDLVAGRKPNDQVIVKPSGTL